MSQQPLLPAIVLAVTSSANSSDPLFDAAVDYETGYNPTSVFLIDPDGDDLSDLLVTAGGELHAPIRY